MSSLEVILGIGLVVVVGLAAVATTALLAVRRTLTKNVEDLTEEANVQRDSATKLKTELAVCETTSKRLNASLKEAESTAEQLRTDLRRFAPIEDVEKHAANITNAAKSEVAKQKQRATNFRDQATVLQTQRDALNRHVKGLKVFKDGCDSIDKITSRINVLKRQLKGLTAFKDGCDSIDKITSRIKQEKAVHVEAVRDNETELVQLVKQIKQRKEELHFIDEEAEMQSFGIYQPRFDFDHSDDYRDAMKKCVSTQKEIVRDKTACTCATTWSVSGSEAKGRTMVNRNIKLMLRAVNGECDAIIAKVKHNNVESSEKRIVKCFEVINNLGSTNEISFSNEYEQLKLHELYMTYEYAALKQEEKEREREIRQAMREEEKAQKEIAKAKEKAEKDETVKEAALEKARRELADLHGKHNAKLEALVGKLETELSEAIDRKAKAIARAQLTKSGHVYVLSNIGTMGDRIFKIGMTRRLEPLERVKELGDASVPYPFDVHAMIYSENAPELENGLHKIFERRRVNLVNLRREYFFVSLDEIRDAVADLHGLVTFKLKPDAEQYRASEVSRREASLASA
jgi:hypothetical protein